MKSRFVRSAAVTFVVFALTAFGTAQGQVGGRGTDVAALTQIAQDQATLFAKEHADAVQWAAGQGLTGLRFDRPNGGVAELVFLRDGRPYYYATDNVSAADSVSTDELLPGGSSGLALTGTGVQLHIWDGGAVRSTHQELTGRVTVLNPGGLSDHATHVSGTMIASGVNASAKGMSPSATLRSFDFGNDTSEMSTEAATGSRVSNHSYGFISGWYFGNLGLGTGWYWAGNVNVSAVEDAGFGLYESSAQTWDSIAYAAPYYLMAKSAGNDRGDSSAGTHFHRTNTGYVSAADAHPADGGASGYDTVSYNGTAKNILTVGAVFDVIGGYAGPGSVVMSSFSGWGPTDDGRIKPDLVGNGIDLFSSISSGNAAYDGTYSGTSMSTPNVSGSLGLLVQYYRSTHGGSDMRSASLKGVALHTADECGANPGPDYSFGWGLLNSKNAAAVITRDTTNPEAIQELVIGQGQTLEQTYTYSDVGPFKATICWTDPPGTAQPYVLDPATPNLVNDLDLRIIGPGPTTYFPWILNPAAPSAAATTGDNTRDNVEIALIGAPAAGNYTVRITHKGTLASGVQDFSLILSGTTSNPVMSLVPTSASDPFVLQGSHIIVPSGGTQVTLELLISGWTPDLLRIYQGRILSSGYTSGSAGSLTPVGWPGTPSLGAFIDTLRPDYTFAGVGSIPGVNTTTLDYEYGATTIGTDVADPGTATYAGTLILDTSVDAEGTFTVGLDSDPAQTYLLDDTSTPISPITLSSALITVADETLCLGAREVSCSTTEMVDNTGVNNPSSPGYSCGFAGGPHDGTVWLKFTASNSSVRINSCGSIGTADDSTFAVYDGTCSSLVEIGCAEDDCGASTFLGDVTVGGLTPGNEYFIQFSAWSPANRAEYALQIECPAPTAGRCCQSGGAVCTEELSADCTALGGAFHGAGTTCGGDNDFNGLIDSCECPFTATPLADPSGIRKNRYLSLLPQNPGQMTALRVTRTVLPSLPPPAFSYAGEQCWVGPPRSIAEAAGSSGSGSPSFTGANLQDSPHCMDWGALATVLHLFDDEIVPSAEFDVRAVDCSCDLDSPASYTAPLTIFTAAWADVVPPNPAVDFVDIQEVVKKFTNVATAVSKVRVDLAPNMPDAVIDFLDIQEAVKRFIGGGYPYRGPVSWCQ